MKYTYIQKLLIPTTPRCYVRHLLGILSDILQQRFLFSSPTQYSARVDECTFLLGFNCISLMLRHTDVFPLSDIYHHSF